MDVNQCSNTYMLVRLLMSLGLWEMHLLVTWEHCHRRKAVRGFTVIVVFLSFNV